MGRCPVHYPAMRLVNQILRLSATDPANHLGCAHLSQLSRAAAEGRAHKPRWQDPIAAILKERGIEHEKAYLDHQQRTQGTKVVRIPEEGNRLNVATSRAKGLCILVGSPKLFEPDCGTSGQMRLANAFCRHLELARVVPDVDVMTG